jgi:chromosome segregation ATPase
MDLEPTHVRRSETDAPEIRSRFEQALFDLEMARAIQRRLEADRAQLGQRIASLDADRAALRKRIDERQSYIEAIHASIAWRVIQRVRALFGRKW